jgi:8-hydroxy-5-deazaflavin:NADPH oxidoreductase
MKIGIIGAGDIGSTLGKAWAKRGHNVVFGVRNIQSPKAKKLLNSADSNLHVDEIHEAVHFGDIIVLAVPWEAAQETIRSVDDISGKIIIDPSNPIGSDLEGVVVPSSTSAAEEISKLAKGARVVKAFNAIGAKTLNNLQFGSHKADAFICGDDLAAKSEVKKLAMEIGFNVVDAGPLSNARLLENLALLWIELAFRQRMGPNIAFKLLTRTSGT